MSADPPPRRRRKSRIAPGPGLDPAQNKAPFEWTEEIHLTYWETLKLSLRRLLANFWPNIHSIITSHPLLLRISHRIPLLITTLLFLTLLFFRPVFEPRFKTLSPWHIELHNAWLRHHRIRESTWILDEGAHIHTSNDPSLVGKVVLQFPQRNGGASIELRDVRFDPSAHYGGISMTKLEQDHVPMRTLFGLGEGIRPVMGVELVGRDVVAVAWGGEGKGTYILKAWSLDRCRSGPPDVFFRPYCALLALRNWNKRSDIPAETMRELVDKHRGIPVRDREEEEDKVDEEGESGRGEKTPWRQRALDEESEMERKKKGFWRLG